jgi:TetR/AcrR family transcriptional repressor of lmrAB and yxaGH operons
MPRRTDSRSRMIHAAAELFRQRGYHATAFSDVIQASGAPRGSTYFHFPGGKQELAREAIALAGDEIEELVAVAAERADGPGSLVRVLGDMVAARLEGSDYRNGCAIATMVLELAPENEELSTEFETVFGRWRAALARQFETSAIAPGRAIGLADLVMSAFEGALVLSRATRSTEAFKTTVQAVAEVIDHEPRQPADCFQPKRSEATQAPGQRPALGLGP